MDRIINVIALLTLISCSRWQTISDQNIIKQEQEKLIHQLSVKLDTITEIWKNTTLFSRDEKTMYKLAREMEKTEPTDQG